MPGLSTASCCSCLLQVLVGAHAVLANGGVIAPAGLHMVALAAKRHSVPCVVLVGLHKLSPLFPHDPDVTFNGMWGTLHDPWRLLYVAARHSSSTCVHAAAHKVLLALSALLVAWSLLFCESFQVCVSILHRCSTPISLCGETANCMGSCFVAVADFQSPGAMVDFDVLAESFVCEDESSPEGMGVEVHNPMYDYIPPHLISLFVTDTGGYTPAYVYRLLAEYYSREDYSLESELIDRMKL